MIFVGIDPGISGGIAAIDSEGAIVLLTRMPTMPSNIAKRKMVDPAAMSNMMRTIVHCGVRPHVALEQVGSMPRQGVVGTFSFGQAYGTVIGVLGALGMPFQFVTPQKWKGHHSLTADKTQSIGLVMRRWPEREWKKSDDGPAEALLIADWLRVQYVRG